MSPCEDRTYYMSLLEPQRFPGVGQSFAAAAAYVWEVVPPRFSNDGDACETGFRLWTKSVIFWQSYFFKCIHMMVSNLMHLNFL